MSSVEPLLRSRRREPPLLTTNYPALGVQWWGGEIKGKFKFSPSLAQGREGLQYQMFDNCWSKS